MSHDGKDTCKLSCNTCKMKEEEKKHLGKIKDLHSLPPFRF